MDYNKVNFSVCSCPLKENKSLSKKERYEERNKIINEGKKSSNPEILIAANRLERDNRAVERAKLSEHVYKSNLRPVESAPEGWKQLDDKELVKLGIDPKDLVDEKSGFKAAIYKSDFENPPKTVIAFAGTEDGPDIKADLTQGLALETKQYNQATLLTSDLSSVLGPQNVETTGHSLGGGLAAMGSAKVGCKATTFNAAGLSPKTAERLNVDRETLAAHSNDVDAFNSSNDPLSVAQDNSGLIKAGITASATVLSGGLGAALGLALSNPDILASALGNRYEIPAAPQNELSWRDKLLHPLNSALTGHGSSQVIENIENEKNNDVSKILNK